MGVLGRRCNAAGPGGCAVDAPDATLDRCCWICLGTDGNLAHPCTANARRRRSGISWTGGAAAVKRHREGDARGGFCAAASSALPPIVCARVCHAHRHRARPPHPAPRRPSAGACPADRVVHMKCLARWQLQSAGKRCASLAGGGSGTPRVDDRCRKPARSATARKQPRFLRLPSRLRMPRAPVSSAGTPVDAAANAAAAAVRRTRAGSAARSIPAGRRA
eukprot:361885-Chlamydomonas_euryale.AAC.10